MSTPGQVWAGLLAATLALAVSSGNALGHGAIHDQLHDSNAALQAQPHNAALYLKRGRLYLEARHFTEAIADFRQALAIDPALRAAYYFLGDALLRQGDADAASLAAERFIAALAAEERDALTRGYRLLGASLLQAGKALPAAAAYQSMLTAATAPQPGDYLQLAEAYVAAGDAYQDAALRVLDDGLARLGQPATLQEMAIAIETRRGHLHSALQRLDLLIQQGQRQAVLLLRRGDLLLQLHQPEPAKASFEAALKELDGLPPARQNSRAMRELRHTLATRLAGF